MRMETVEAVKGLFVLGSALLLLGMGAVGFALERDPVQRVVGWTSGILGAVCIVLAFYQAVRP